MLCKALSVLVFSLWVLITDEGIAAEKRHAESHVHGVAEINIVVEGKKVVVEFRSPAEGLMGFEHEANTEADKKKRDAALKVIKERFGELVVFDKSLGCRFQPGEVVIVQSDPGDDNDQKHGKSDHKKSGEHSEVRATHNFACEKGPAGSRVQFGVTKLFSNIHELKVQVLSDAKQSGATIKNDKGDVRL